MNNHLKGVVRLVFQQLKGLFGQPIVITNNTYTNNVETGVQTVASSVSATILNAIVLPATEALALSEQRKEKDDFALGDVGVIIETTDLPTTFTIELHQTIMTIGSVVYTVFKENATQEGQGKILYGRRASK